MFCFQCGQELLDAARFCAGCGSPASTAALPPTASRATVPSRDDSITKQPYRWGKFQGWCLTIATPIWAVGSLIAADTPEEHDSAILLAIACALVVPMGIGIIRRRRFGLILVYVTLALTCIFIVIAFARGGLDAARDAAIGGPFWVACTIYYHKRREEFT